jgi:TonB family protein
MTNALTFPSGFTARNLALEVASLGLGALFTYGLFFGIARFERTTTREPVAAIEDLRVVEIPVQPPPPPKVEQVSTEPAPNQLVGIDTSEPALESAVRITVAPPQVDTPIPVAPRATIEIARMHTEFKPKVEMLLDKQHIFQTSEVDQAPTVIYRKNPYVSSRDRGDAEELRATFLLVVDTNGAPTRIRVMKSSGNPDFDRIVQYSLSEWTFSPAMKQGKKVKCMVQQLIAIRWSGSRFEL